MWTVDRVRQQFLDYFDGHDHQITASSPLVPHNDPTLMFTAAGMVQFKNYFTGVEQPTVPRATTAQKCVRAGGKHNDLENVGYTARHHTFFEMMGNFSFGDYFKDQAIELAWNLLTREFNLPADRLLITVYHDDDQAAGLWRKIAGISDDRIIRINGSDNFWTMGDTGPCGPCSEIFYDHGEHVAGGPPGSPEQDGDRFVEIWNLVFMQYEQQAGNRINLPKPSIDTGSGLERLTAVLQGAHNNYDIDLFKSLINYIVDITGIKAEGDYQFSHRVIADHLRASCFLIAGGVTPSNEGRGYVLRRIMRRAMRHGYLLGYQQPLMHQLVPSLIDLMGDHYGELNRAQAIITETLRLEEERFRETLGRGLKLLSEETRHLLPQAQLSGQVAFKLYDTYGFPLDLTQDILRGDNRTVDLEAFDAAMAQQKADARASWVGNGDQTTDTIWYQIYTAHGATEFLGYDRVHAEGIIQSLIIDGQICNQLSAGQEGYLIVNQTPFYAESGGQMGDVGSLQTLQSQTPGSKAYVLDTVKKVGELFVHHIKIDQGHFTIGDTIELVVDGMRRQSLQANHSATHLLHAVLRKHLGEQVTQKGSLVAPDRLRFDFNYNGTINTEELQAIEDQVNQLIRRNTATETHIMKAEDALKSGAMALFGEKYAEDVRVVKLGTDDQAATFSVELCGGLHVGHTGDIGYFKIISESGIAAGVRRIEALSGNSAEQYCQAKIALLQQCAGIIKSPDDQLLDRLQTLLNDKKQLSRQVKDLQTQLAQQGTSQAVDQMTINGITVIKRTLVNVTAKDLKTIADQLRQNLQNSIVIVGGTIDDKASLVVGLTPDIAGQYNAIDLVKIGATALQGSGGGGRIDMAQAGGPDAQALPQAFTAIEQQLRIL